MWEFGTFGPEHFEGLTPERCIAVAARAVQRCMPLYRRSRNRSPTYDEEISLLNRALVASSTYCQNPVWRGAFERLHEAIGGLALSLMREKPDDPAEAVAQACSELCYALVQYSLGNPHAIHTVPNNALRAAWLAEPGTESQLRFEITQDAELYRDLTADLPLPSLDGHFPLWSSPPPPWYVSAESQP